MTNEIANRFDAERERLRRVAHRMLGSEAEADDAVQEAWLKVSAADTAAVENISGWLTTVVARVCLDMLRSRKSRREDFVDEAPASEQHAIDPETETLVADSVGVALMIVLDRLDPAERIALVLHDMFGLSFDEIAPIVGRSSEAARQLASRARRRVHGAPTEHRAGERKIAEAFLAAIRAGDVEGLVAVLDPQVSVTGAAIQEIRGAREWAKNAVYFTKAAQSVHVARVDGKPALIFAPNGKLDRALVFLEIADDKIRRVEIVTDLSKSEVSVF